MSAKKKPDVSVLILTFNPDTEKLINTIRSATKQKNICTEIIISDDCSEQFPKEAVMQYVLENHVPIKIIQNKENLGTVRNCLNAAVASTGKYIFTTSPGDYLYDANTLSSFFRFAEKNNKKVIFGKAINYYRVDNKLCFEYNTDPLYPELYKSERGFVQKVSFFLRNWIVGASFFRERDTFIFCLKKAVQHVKYIEDASATAYFLMEGSTVTYYDRIIVWYEYGSGISTNKNEKWTQIIADEKIKLYDAISKEYEGAIADFISIINTSQSKAVKSAKLFFHHPLIFMAALYCKCRKRKTAHINSKESEKKMMKMISSVK